MLSSQPLIYRAGVGVTELLSLVDAVQNWRRNRPIVSVHPGQHPTEGIEIAGKPGSRLSKPDAGERRSLRWREPDSNHWFRVTRPTSQDRLTSPLPDSPPTEIGREREPTPRGCRAPSAGPMVRIRLPPAGTLRMISKRLTGAAAVPHASLPTYPDSGFAQGNIAASSDLRPIRCYYDRRVPQSTLGGARG
jgi:hypothetical protein